MVEPNPNPLCPICKFGVTAPHCPATNPTCLWRKCRAEDCRVTFDPANLRAVKHGEQITWPEAF